MEILFYLAIMLLGIYVAFEGGVDELGALVGLIIVIMGAGGILIEYGVVT